MSALLDKNRLPRSDCHGSIMEADYCLSHAIWRNSHGSYQPETGVRPVIDGKIIEGQFQLIEHGCPDFDWATPIILNRLRKGRDTYRIATLIEWLWARKKKRAVITAAMRKFDYLRSALAGEPQ